MPTINSTTPKALQNLVFEPRESCRISTIASALVLEIQRHLRSLKFGALARSKNQILKCFGYNRTNSSSRAVSGISRLPIDSLVEIFRFCNISELGQLCRTTQGWRRVLNAETGQDLWRHISIREGVPLLEKGKSENPKEEFRFLRSLTLSHRIMGRHLGEVVDLDPQGEIKPLEPRYICFDRFKQLRDGVDPFDPEQPMRDNYLVVVPPRYFKIRDLDRPLLQLDETRTRLIPKGIRIFDLNGPRDLIAPFSFQNLRMLAKYPLARVGQGPVFHSEPSWAALEQCNVRPAWDQICIMRKESVLKNVTWVGEQGQRQVVADLGWKIFPLCLRGLANTLQILSRGTCPEVADPLTCVRSDEIVEREGRSYVPIIGIFAPDSGLRVKALAGFAAMRGVGVVPGLPVEV